jgi:hypothetical protein
MGNGSSKAAVHLSRTQEYQQATSDYARLRKAEQEKTVRLRALRLTKEAADREAADEAAAAKAAAKKPTSKRRKASAGAVRQT